MGKRNRAGWALEKIKCKKPERNWIKEKMTVIWKQGGMKCRTAWAGRLRRRGTGHTSRKDRRKENCHEKFSQNMSNTVQTSGCCFQKNSVLKRLSAISRSAFAKFYHGYVTKVGLNFINLNGKEGSLRLVPLTSMTAALLRSYKTLGSDLWHQSNFW